MQVNEYFDGKVTSLSFENQDGRATTGVMEPGRYEFGTSENEWIKVVSGSLAIQLAGQDAFVAYGSGSDFRVPADVKFQVKVDQPTAYICFYG